MAAGWKKDKDLASLSLDAQPWKPMNVDGRDYMVKGVFGNKSYSVLVTDFGVIWEESLQESDIIRQSKVNF